MYWYSSSNKGHIVLEDVYFELSFFFNFCSQQKSFRTRSSAIIFHVSWFSVVANIQYLFRTGKTLSCFFLVMCMFLWFSSEGLSTYTSKLQINATEWSDLSYCTICEMKRKVYTYAIEFLKSIKLDSSLEWVRKQKSEHT